MRTEATSEEELLLELLELLDELRPSDDSLSEEDDELTDKEDSEELLLGLLDELELSLELEELVDSEVPLFEPLPVELVLSLVLE